MTRTQIGTANVSNGVAETSYTIPSDANIGTNTLYAVYQQNDEYVEAEGYNTFEIRVPTVITVENVLASIGETASFVANVKYNTNQNVNEGTVQFFLEGTMIGSAVNVVDGVATLQYEIPSNTATNSEITATFNETSTYGASTTTTPGNLKIRESINVTVTNLSGNRGETKSIVANITEQDDDPVTTGTAQLYIDNTISGEPVTVTNGVATFSYNIANNAVVGSHTIKVVYGQTDDYDAAEGTGTLIVRTPTVLAAQNISANKGTTVSLSVLVTDENSIAIPSGTVNITVGNDAAVQANVNASGEATINYAVPNDASGTINFTAAYVENDNYQAGTTATAGVITIRKGIVLTVSNVKANLGDNVTLTSQVVDENSNNVNTGTVNYDIE